MLRVGVIGVGHLGRHHARVYSSLEGCELVGVHDADAGAARSVAEEFGALAFADAGDLVSAVDAASIAVPTTFHHEVGSLCLERGVHVLIEKPIASTVEEASALVERARGGNLVLQVGHIERFNPAVRAAAEVLTRPMFVEAHRLGVFVPRGTDVPVVLDLMIHDIDLILSTVGARVETVDAVGVPVLSPNVDIANARLTFEGGCVANVTASRVSREKVRKIRFFQPDAYVTIDSITPRAQVFRRREVSPETMRRIATGEIEGGLEDIVEHQELRLDDAEPLALELASFVSAVTTGSRPVVDGEDGLRALEVALEVLRQMGETDRSDTGTPAT